MFRRVGLLGLAVALAATLQPLRAETETGAAAPASSSWTIVPSPNNNGTGAQPNVLRATACASATECWAVGESYTSSGSAPLIEEWDGGAWAIVSSPSTGSADSDLLYSVTCASPSECWAVGQSSNSSNPGYQTLVEEWNGSSWSIISSPNTSISDIDNLYSVTCASAAECWAVGDYTPIPSPFFVGNTQALVEEWTGSSWTIVTSHTSSLNMNHLYAVTCTSTTLCRAVGAYSSGSGSDQTLTEVWNGSAWSLVSSPNSGTQYNALSGVTCTSSAACWAVGESESSGSAQTLIEAWTGSSWSLVASPNTSAAYNFLISVACTSSAACWAVGDSSSGASNAQTLIEEWNGSIWTIVNSPNVSGASADGLNGVTCTSPLDCWAAGVYVNGGGTDQTLIENDMPAPPQSGSIAGTVTAASGGALLPGICVGAVPAGGGTVAGTAASASDGTYAVSGLNPGSYNVRFDSQGDCTNGTAASYVTQWYRNQPSQSSANAVAVTAGSTTSPIDAAMVAGAAPAPGGAYTAVTPFRVWDTRATSPVQCSNPRGCALGPGNNSNVEVVGDPSGNGTIPSNATAIVLNLTGIAPTQGTYLSVAPAGSSGLGSSSNINLDAGAIQANLVTVALPLSGLVSVYNSMGFVDVAMDVQGYFTPSTSTPAAPGQPGTFHPISPERVCDTRGGSGSPCSSGASDNQLAGGHSRAITVTSATGGIPNNGSAMAAVFNLTAVSGTAGTYLTAYPPASDGSCPTPSTSNLNVSGGAILPNRVIVPIGSGAAAGKVCIYNAAGSINFIIDVNGWFGNGNETVGSLFFPVNPERICDTRSGNSTACTGNSITAAGKLAVNGVGTVAGDPTAPVAIVVNTTGIQGSAGTFLSLYPDGPAPNPLTSDLNPSAGQIIANLVIVGLNAGKLDVYNALGTIDVALDAEGWFA